MSASVEVVSYPATVTVVDSAVTVSVVSQAVTVEAGSSGPQGVAGPTGPTGATGAAGSSGVVSVVSPITNTGTSSAAVLGFDQAANNTTNDTRYARLGAANAFTVGGHTITNAVASVVPLVITAHASQTNYLFQANASAGTSGTGVVANGGLTVGTYSQSANQTNIHGTFGYVGIRMTGGSASLGVSTGGAGNIGVIVKGAASQTANLFEAQSSAGSVLAKVESSGSVVGQAFALPFSAFRADTLSSGGALTFTRTTAALSNPGANASRLYFRDGTTAGTLKLVVRAGAAGAETTILDNIPQ